MIRGIGVVRIERQVSFERCHARCNALLLLSRILDRLILLNGEGDRPIVIRADCIRRLIVFRRLLVMTPACEELGEPVVRLEVPGVQRERALEGAFRRDEIRHELQRVAPRDVCLRQVRRESDCPIRRRDGIG